MTVFVTLHDRGLQTLADNAGQALQRAHVGDDGDVHLLHAEAGTRAAVPDVARCDEVHSGSDTGACTGGEHSLSCSSFLSLANTPREHPSRRSCDYQYDMPHGPSCQLDEMHGTHTKGELSAC